MSHKILLYYNTLKYLKLKQVYYRIFYLIRNKLRRVVKFSYPQVIEGSVSTQKLILQPSITAQNSYEGKQKFNFLNIAHDFKEKIDWNYEEHGKLWVYNLNYFEFLVQEKFCTKQGEILILDYCTQNDTLTVGLDSFPISLRIIFWIKFITKNNIENKQINQILASHVNILVDNIEYHLLGNHLLENGFALLHAAYYLNDKKLLRVAEEILFVELEEQILNDGGHFELSPMYHQLMLYRVLDCYNLVSCNRFQEKKRKELERFLYKKAVLMLGWLESITFQNGDIPLVNDSTNGIAPTSKQLFEYAATLNVQYLKTKLTDSGYRKLTNQNFELLIDIGKIGPDYIPGHAHSDTLSYVLYVKGNPLIIDKGISTYEKNNQRQLERSTQSHNTVMLNKQEQSEVWGGFRVAKRAYPIVKIERETEVLASHTGYQSLNATHERLFKITDNHLVISDSIFSQKEYKAQSYLHFAPNVSVEIIDSKHVKANFVTIKIKNSTNFYTECYDYCDGYNNLITSQRLVINFTKNTTLEFLQNK